MSEHSAAADDSKIDSDFELDDDIRQSLNTLLNIPLEFENTSDEDEDEEVDSNEKRARDESIERKIKAMFADEKDDPGGSSIKDMDLEVISDNELDGPESGECDTSDGELPDSPGIVVTVPDTPPPSLHPVVTGADQVSTDEESEVEVLSEYMHNRGREYNDIFSSKVLLKNPDREVTIEDVEPERPKSREKKVKSPSKSRERSVEKKLKKKKDKIKKKLEEDDAMKKKLKLKKYLARLDQYRAKCFEYIEHISKKCESTKRTDSDKIKQKLSKIRTLMGNDAKVKSVVAKVKKDREGSPHSSSSSKIELLSQSSHSSRKGKTSRSSSFDKERKSKSTKKSKSSSKDMQQYYYENYMKYLRSEKEKCFEEEKSLRKKSKSKRKSRKSGSSSPEKSKDRIASARQEPRLLTFDQFCQSRELCSPSKESPLKTPISNETQVKKHRTISVDSTATTATVRSEPELPTEHEDDDKLFITYSELLEQDKKKMSKTSSEDHFELSETKTAQRHEGDKEKIEEILEKDPALKSISVFTSVLFKGDSSGIPFLQEDRPPSPKIEPLKPKLSFTQSSGPDEIYDNDDLSSISQNSLSPSRSPAPKIHNKALFNFLENQKDKERVKEKLPLKKNYRSANLSKSRSRSKSPKKIKKHKSKYHSPTSRSSSPPLMKSRSPEGRRTKTSPPAYLRDRWNDYPSPNERRREQHHHHDKISRSGQSRSRLRVRVGHRSRSSSEERYYRHYRSRSRSRSHSRSHSRSRSPPPHAMVHTEKRRKLKEEHERALDSLRATIHKPMSRTPLSITHTIEGDSFKPVLDNYIPIDMNEVKPGRSYCGPTPPPSMDSYSTVGHYLHHSASAYSYTPPPHHYYHPPHLPHKYY